MYKLLKFELLYIIKTRVFEEQSSKGVKQIMYDIKGGRGGGEEVSHVLFGVLNSDFKFFESKK